MRLHAVVSAEPGKSRTCNGSLGPGQVETEDELPSQLPPFPSTAFCVFSLIVAYHLLTLLSASPEDGKETSVHKGTPLRNNALLRGDILRSQQTNTRLAAWRSGAPFLYTQVYRKAKPLHVKSCSGPKQIDQH